MRNSDQKLRSRPCSNQAIIYDSNPVKKIPVKLKQNPYSVLIGSGLLRRSGAELRRLLPSKASRVFVITSPQVRRRWGQVLEGSLGKAHIPVTVLEMNDGEPAKHMHTVEQLAEQMVDARADRQSTIVAFGGGVVGDAAGFLAAIFMRGIPFVQVPTTFLAQVDASIGGKTGVNLRAGKNLIGAFHQPRAVLIDPDVLSTLSDREFRAGLFESLKCGVIRDKALFEFMNSRADKILRRDRKALERVIVDSVRVKAAVVAADEKESDLRRILNFGHTLGHALESATGYGHFLHGEAVAWGMIAASIIGRDLQVCNDKTAARIQSSVQLYGPLPNVPCGADGVLNRLSADKKTVAGEVHFVLPKKIAQVTIRSGVPVEVIRSAVEQIRAYA